MRLIGGSRAEPVDRTVSMLVPVLIKREREGCHAERIP